jgi:membrane protease YdiL (CAAX protease family)
MVLPVFAWVVIVGAILFVLLWPGRAPQASESEDGLWLLRTEARMFVGFQELFGSMAGDLYTQAETFNQGSPMQRLGFIALAGELKGPKEALRLLRELRQEWTVSPGDVEREEALAKLLQKQYTAEAEHAENPLTQSEREQIKHHLGWLGELALTPANSPAAAREAVVAPATRTAIVMITAMLVALGSLFVGLALAVLFFVFVITRRLKAHGEPVGTGTGGVYAETFAVWMLLFFGLGRILAELVIDWFPQLYRYRLLVSGVLMLASLAALAWPVLRGVKWGQLRREIGLVGGPSPWLEPIFGIGCYLAALPLTAFAFVVVLILMRLLGQTMGMPIGESQGPSHPLIGFIATGDWVVWMQAIFLAAVVAPIVEETMFRGILYRHLREMSAGAGKVASVLFSAFVASFIFAVIHPQGWLLVPVLMSLALGFTFTREWRGSLVGSMTAHGLHNGLVTLLAIGILG